MTTLCERTLKSGPFLVFDVKDEGLAGASDERLVEIAREEGRVIVTHDKDFESLFSPGRDVGVVLIRLGDQRPDTVKEKLGLLLESEKREKSEGNVVVVADQRFVVHRSFGEG